MICIDKRTNHEEDCDGAAVMDEGRTCDGRAVAVDAAVAGCSRGHKMGYQNSVDGDNNVADGVDTRHCLRQSCKSALEQAECTVADVDIVSVGEVVAGSAPKIE